MTPAPPFTLEGQVDCEGLPMQPGYIYLRDPFRADVWHAPRCQHRAPRATTKETP